MVAAEARVRGISEIWRDSAWVALLALASVCLVSTGIWENGDIELKWWAVKAWANGIFPDFHANHHNLRWGITLPAVAWVFAVGESAVSYLLLNHVVFALTTACLYALIRQLTSPLTAALALAVWLINPVVYSLPSNLMPEVYSMIYPVAALLFLHHANTSGSRWSYAWAVVMMFLAYGAKETNIFFMPGWGLYEILRRRWLNVGMIVGVFGACLLVETLVVNAVLSESDILFGRAQAIMQAGHLDEMTNEWPYQFVDLLTRWWFIAETNFDRLEYAPKLLYWGFFILTAWKAWQWIRARTLAPPPGPLPEAAGETVAVTWAMGLSFAFFTTFFILSLDPLILGQPLNDRYLWPLLVQATIVLSVPLHVLVQHLRGATSGPQGILGGALRFAEPLTIGRWALVSLALIAAFATLTRWPIEIAAMKIRRQGFDHPYTVFTANDYYANARDQLMRGCTLVFPRPRPAQTILVHTFRFREIEPTLALYDQQLDGLVVDGHRLRAWAVPRAEWDAMDGKLYHAPEDPGYRPTAIRLEGMPACDEAYFYGNADLAPQDQRMNRALSDPPPRASATPDSS